MMDPFLELELKKHDLAELYHVLLDHGIIVETLWSLNEQDLLEMGLSIGKYKNKWSAKRRVVQNYKHWFQW